MLRIVVVFPFVLAVLAIATPSAEAYPDFMKAFVAKYLDDNENEEYVEHVKKEAKCWLCHQGKKKKNRNVYGAKLDELLGKEDRKNADKIAEALDEVAEMHSVEDDEDSPTFGELIADGKLPGGDLEDSKEEPVEEEESESE